MFPTMMRPGLNVQPPMIQNQFPMAGTMYAAPTIGTSSIKYTTSTQPVLMQQPLIQQTAMPVQTYQTQTYQTQIAAPTVTTIPTQIHASISPVHYQQQVTTVSGCPAPVYGQPIVIEGVMSGAQSYFGPKQTRLLQAHEVRPELSQVKLGATQTELIPYEQIITEYDQLERKIRIPYNKYITEYQIVEHQVEYHPEIAYQTETDFVPQQRVEEEVQYQTQEKRYETGWNRSMRTSQRIEGAIGISGISGIRTMQQPTTSYVQAISPQVVQQASYLQSASPVVVQQVPQQAQVIVGQPQMVNQVGYVSQMPQQWPTTWTTVNQKRKSSS